MDILRMRRLVNQWSISVFFLLLIIKFLQLLKKLGIEPKQDGWRKVTRAYLRTEQSKFALVCYGLDFSSQIIPEEGNILDKGKGCVIKGLADFFQQQPEAYWQIKWDSFSAQRVKKDSADIVYAEFNEEGYIRLLSPFFDLSKGSAFLQGMTEELKHRLIQGAIEIYNKTMGLPDKKRPLVFKEQLGKWLLTQPGISSEKTYRQAEYFTERILSAVFIHFEEVSWQADLNYARFEPPKFIKRKHPGFGPFNIVCRLNKDTNQADIWVQCHHVCIDGLPMQELLEKLEARWGRANAVKFPPSSYKKTLIPELFSTKDGKGAVFCLNQVVNFRNFLGITTEINKENSEHMKKCITAFRLLIWRLGNHPVFQGKKFLIPVNIPARGNRERTLGFVIIRPSVYFDKHDTEMGFLKFQQEFNRQVKATIIRKSESYRLLEAYAYLHPSIYALVIKLMPSAVKELVGSIGVSIINKADSFIAPFSDVHTDGFIAISNFFTPTENKDIGCYVSVKGPADKIKDYLQAIEEIAKTQT